MLATRKHVVKTSGQRDSVTIGGHRRGRGGPATQPATALLRTAPGVLTGSAHLTPPVTLAYQATLGNHWVAQRILEERAHAHTGTLMRKGNIGVNDLAGSLSTKARLNKERNKASTFDEIKDYLGKYEAATNTRDELRMLQTLEMLVNEWQHDHGAGKGKNGKLKAASLAKLLPKIHAEIANLGAEQQAQYGEKLANTNKSLSGLDYTKSPTGKFGNITATGARGAVTSGAKFADARAKAAGTGMTDEELAAIRIYTGGDYKYINPVLNKNKGWLAGSANALSGLDPHAKETQWGHTGVFNKMREQKGKLTRRQARILQVEAMQHTRLTMSGLQKLPVTVGDGFRGMTISKSQLDAEYKTGNEVTWEGLSSCSTDRMVSDSYAKKPETGKVGLLLHLKIKFGRDIGELSQEKGEKEILVMPGAKFKVLATPVLRQGIAVYDVTLEQTAQGSVAGVPPGARPAQAAQGPLGAGGQAAPQAGVAAPQGAVAAPQRPGGSIPAVSPDEALQNAASAMARSLIAKSTDEAHGVTRVLTGIASQHKGRLEGLKYQLKTEASLARKLYDRAKTHVDKDGPVDAIKAEAATLNDVLRFTLSLPPNTYKACYDSMQPTMASAGYIKAPGEWNAWDDYRGIYKGINMTFKTARGQLFEVQLHTDASLAAKEAIHPLYEEKRDRHTTPERRNELDAQMKARWAAVPTPKGMGKK